MISWINVYEIIINYNVWCLSVSEIIRIGCIRLNKLGQKFEKKKYIADYIINLLALHTNLVQFSMCFSTNAVFM